MRAVLVVAGMIAASVAARSANADLITYAFHGQITSINLGSGFAGIDVGTTFSGYFQFDTGLAGPDGNSSPNFGVYTLSPSPDNLFNLNMAGWDFVGPVSPVSVRNNFGPEAVDGLQVSSIHAIPAGWTASTSSMFVSFDDSTGSAYANDLLPASFDPSQFDSASLVMRINNVTFPGGSAPGGQFVGTINLSAVPEPSSALLAAAAAGLGLWKRRRARAR